MHQTVKTLIVKKLYQEYEEILRQRYLNIKPAIIDIRPMKNQWGEWHPLTRVITLSGELVTKYPWHIVVEVLKHEMAHQIVSEVFMVNDAHGPSFRKAAKLLGTESWACNASLPEELLSTVTQGKRNDKYQKLLRQVKQLLSLAESGNSEHEASTAMKKVKELTQTYNLESLRENTEQNPFQTISICHNRKRRESYQASICSLLREFFGVEIVYSTSFGYPKLEVFACIEIMGRQSRVAIAEQIYWYLFNQLPLLWKEYQKSHGCIGTKNRNQFYCGVIQGFSDQLAKGESSTWQNEAKTSSPETAINETKELILKEKNDLSQYVTYRHPRLQKVSRYRRQSDGEHFQAGVTEGQNLDIRYGISPSCSKTQKTLSITGQTQK